MAGNTRTLKIQVVGDSRDFERALASSQTRLKSFGGVSNQVSKSVSVGLGAMSAAVKVGAAGVAGGLIYSVKKAGDFEHQLSSLGSVSGATARQMDALRKSAVKAGADTKFSALEAAQAQTELAKGGLKTSQILKGGLSSSLALAAAGELELADAASTTVNAMKLFGISGSRSIKVADALATAANSTTADVSDFALALNQAGSAAKTVGLSFPETITALETLAEVGIKGSDAGTSLKTALVQLASPSSNKAAEMAEKLGINVFDSTGKIKSLVDVSKELQDGLGDLTKEQRISAATTLVGQDGFRALLALYDAGPKKIAKLEAELNKQGTAAKVAKEKQDNLKGSLEALGGSVETLGINVGTLMLPAIRKGADEVQKFTNQISKIAGDKKLDVGEKLAKSFEVAKADARPWVDKLERSIIQADIPGRVADLLDQGTDRIGDGFQAGTFTDKFVRQLEEADLPDKIADLVSEAVPKVGEAAAKAGLVAAGAFARSFSEADVWGKLAIGGWLLAKMGGLGAFRTMGVTAGAQMGAGIATGAAAGVAGGAAGKTGLAAGIAAKAAPALKVAGRVTLAAALLSGIGEGIKASKEDLNFDQAFSQAAHGFSFGAFGTDVTAEMQRNFDELAKSIEENPRRLDWAKIFNTVALSEKQREVLGKLVDFQRTANDVRGDLEKRGIRVNIDTQDVLDGARAVRDALDRMSSGATTSIRNLRTNVRLNTRLIKKSLGEDTAEGKEALAANFRAAAQNIKRSMDAGTIATKEGTAEIERLMVKALQGFGFSKQQALNISKTGDPDANAGREGGASGAMRKQRGGTIFGGAPSGDSVPAMLERGEYVLNRNAVKRIGTGTLDAVNFGAAARFQKGGGVGSVTGDTDVLPGLLNALQRMSSAKGTPIFIQSGRRTLAEQASLAASKGVYGPNNRQGAAAPSPNAPHVRGIAADITPGSSVFGSIAAKYGLAFNVPGEPWHIALMNAALAGSAGAAIVKAEKLAKVMVNGPGSPLRSMVQGALDITRGGAQGLLDKAATAASLLPGTENMPAGGGRSSAGGSYDKAKLIALWNRVNPGLGDSNLMAAIALAESGGNASIVNSIGAGGLWQIHPPEPGYLDPVTNARIAGRKLSTQGLQAWEAYTNGNYRQFLQKGGLAGFQAGGGVDTRFAPFGLGNRNSPAARAANAASGALADGNFGGLLGMVKTGKTAEIRTGLADSMIAAINGIGFEPQAALMSNLEGYTNLFGDYADRAGSLTDTTKIQDALQSELERRQKLSPVPDPLFPDSDQQSIVDGMLGRVGGLTQLDWLQKQLTTMFDWRNVITDTNPIVAGLQAQTEGLLADARARLAAALEAIGTLEKKITRLEKERDRKADREEVLKHRIDDEMDKPAKKRNRKKLEEWRDELGQRHAEHVSLNEQLRVLRGEKRGQENIRDSLDGDSHAIIPALEAKQSDLGDARSSLLGNLVDIQGLGGPLERLNVLPEIGGLGGKLFDVQSLIKDLTEHPPRVVATVPETESKVPEALTASALLEGLKLSKALLASGADVKSLFPDLPGFATGTGSAPRGMAWVGERGPEIVDFRGGERVYTNQQSVAMAGGHGGGGGDVYLDAKFYVDGQEFRGMVRAEIKQRERESRGSWRAGKA